MQPLWYSRQVIVLYLKHWDWTQDISMSAGSRERGQDLPRCPVRTQIMPLLGLAPFREYHQTLGFRGVASIQDMPYRLARRKMKLALV